MRLHFDAECPNLNMIRRNDTSTGTRLFTTILIFFIKNGIFWWWSSLYFLPWPGLQRDFFEIDRKELPQECDKDGKDKGFHFYNDQVNIRMFLWCSCPKLQTQISTTINQRVGQRTEENIWQNMFRYVNRL